MAGTKYMLGLAQHAPEVHRNTLLISASPTSSISPVFGGNPGQIRIETGGTNSIHPRQDYALFGSQSRILAGNLQGNAWGENSRGANETNGTNQMMHSGGILSNQALYGARVERAEYRKLAPKEGKDWAYDTDMRLRVKYEVTPKMKEKPGYLRELQKRGLLSTDPRTGKDFIEHWVYTNSHVVAAGLPAPNIIVGNKSIQKLGLEAYGFLNHARSQGTPLSKRPLLGFADVNIHLTWDTLPPEKALIGNLGPGDSAFIGLQKEYHNSKEKGHGLSHHLLIGRDANMQPANTQALFDVNGPYLGKFRFINTPMIKEVVLIDRGGQPIEIQLRDEKGNFRNFEEVAKELEAKGAKLKTVLEKPKPITNLNELAQYFRKTGETAATDFLTEGYLPIEYFKPEYITNDGKIDVAKVKQLPQPEQALNSNFSRLIKSACHSGPKNKILREFIRKTNRELTTESNGDLSFTVDFVDLSQGYNGKKFIDSVLADSNGNATPKFADMKSSEVPFLPDGSPSQMVGRRMMVLEKDGQRVDAPRVYTLGAFNGVIGPANHTNERQTRGPVGPEIVKAHADKSMNVSPFGLQSNLAAVEAATPTIAGSLAQFAGKRPIRRTRGESSTPTKGLANQIAFARKQANREQQISTNRNQPTESFQVQGTIESKSIPVMKEKLLVENELFHDVLKNFWTGIGVPREGIRIGFHVDSNGQLSVRTRGAFSGLAGNKKALAEAIRNRLNDNPELAERLGNLVVALGGDASVNLQWVNDGTLRANSVRFETPQEQMVAKVRARTRKGGSRALTETAVTDLLGGMMDSPMHFRFDSSGGIANMSDRGVRQQVAQRAEMGGLGSKLEVSKQAERADGGQEIIYSMTENGRRVGSAIVATKPESIKRMLQYLAGEQRLREAGQATGRVVSVMKIPPQSDLQGSDYGLLILVKDAPGKMLSDLPSSDQQKALAALGKSLAEVQSIGGKQEKQISPAQHRKQRHSNFMKARLQEAIQGDPRAAAELEALAKKVPTDSFFQGPIPGRIGARKVFFSQPKSGKAWQVAYSNFYDSRGWANITLRIADAVRTLPQASKQAVIRSFVETRLKETQRNYTEGDVSTRMKQVEESLAFWDRLNAIRNKK